MGNEQVVLIAREGELTNLLHQALGKRFPLQVIYEDPPSKWRLLRLRKRRLGAWRVLGQILFQLFVVLPMRTVSGQRRAAILRGAGFDPGWNAGSAPARTPSVNSRDCIGKVRALAPQVIVINGTRIVKGSTLKAFGVPVLNVHVGITPKYRGVHGGYWALYNNDPENCGVTVHLVDEGIDTGAILHQARIHPEAADNFATYPVLQVVEAAPLLVQAVEQVLGGKVRPIQGVGPSTRWEHPTLLQYIRGRMAKGIG